MWFSYKQLFILGLVFIVLQVTFTHGMDGGKKSPKRDRTPPKTGKSGSGGYYSGQLDEYGKEKKPGESAYFFGKPESHRSRGGSSDKQGGKTSK